MIPINEKNTPIIKQQAKKMDPPKGPSHKCQATCLSRDELVFGPPTPVVPNKPLKNPSLQPKAEGFLARNKWFLVASSATLGIAAALYAAPLAGWALNMGAGWGKAAFICGGASLVGSALGAGMGSLALVIKDKLFSH